MLPYSILITQTAEETISPAEICKHLFETGRVRSFFIYPHPHPTISRKSEDEPDPDRCSKW